SAPEVRVVEDAFQIEVAAVLKERVRAVRLVGVEGQIDSVADGKPAACFLRQAGSGLSQALLELGNALTGFVRFGAAKRAECLASGSKLRDDRILTIRARIFHA